MVRPGAGGIASASWSIPSRWGLIATWLVVVVGFGAAVTMASRSYGGLDDANQAYQRPGFLDARPLPSRVFPSVTPPGRRAVVFFVRPAQLRSVVAAVSRDPSLTSKASVVVVDSVAPPVRGASVPLVGDPSGQLALSYGMRQPRDGGPPVGYAEVDSSGRVRYATLDPGMADRLGEVATILRAMP